jgi:hypothetical protein
MKIVQILKQAWSLGWHYRSLWFFGIVVALTTVSWGALVWFVDWDDASNPVLIDWEISARDQQWLEKELGVELPRRFTLRGSDVAFEETLRARLPEELSRPLLALALVLAAFGLAALGIAFLARYVAETALIRMVGHYEETGEKVSLRLGLRMGWSIAAMRVFLIDVIVFLFAFSLLVVLYLPAAVVAILLVGSPAPVALPGGILAGGLALAAAAATIVVWPPAGVVARLAARACVLDDAGVWASVQYGYRVMRGRMQDVSLVWLATFAIEVLYPIIIVPLAVVLSGAGLVFGSLGGIFAWSLTPDSLHVVWSWIAAVATGLFLFNLMLWSPLLLLNGLREVLQSSTWTLAYRALGLVPGAEPEAIPLAQPA